MPMSPKLLRPIANNLDPDAAVYLNAVAQADGQQLEPAVRKAINDFVVGCKRDGIWPAIKASCILMGARTLSGALTPLKGSAPTNNGPFVSGDYNRETGLIGNGSTKWLNTGRNNNADPQDSNHMAVWVQTATTSSSGANSFPAYIGVGNVATGASILGRLNNNSTTHFSHSRAGTAVLFVVSAGVGGLFANARTNGTQVITRVNGTNTTSDQDSQTSYNGNIGVFRQGPGEAAALSSYNNGRLSFYSIGEFLDLALLDARVTALFSAIGAAIP